jgi:hypothetical protein
MILCDWCGQANWSRRGRSFPFPPPRWPGGGALRAESLKCRLACPGCCPPRRGPARCWGGGNHNAIAAAANGGHDVALTAGRSVPQWRAATRRH